MADKIKVQKNPSGMSPAERELRNIKALSKENNLSLEETLEQIDTVNDFIITPDSAKVDSGLEASTAVRQQILWIHKQNDALTALADERKREIDSKDALIHSILKSSNVLAVDNSNNDNSNDNIDDGELILNELRNEGKIS